MPADKQQDRAAPDIDTDAIANMSGLDLIRAMQNGQFPPPPITVTLGYAIHSVEVGKVVFRGQPSQSVLNPFGAVHGGWFGTLLDSCMASAVQTRLPPGMNNTTLEYKVNILRPLTSESGMVEAIGTTVHVGRRTGIAEGRIVGVEDGKTYATGSTTCLVFPI